MGPAPEGGIYHTPRNENLTENWRHESQTLRAENLSSRQLLKNPTKTQEKKIVSTS